MAIPFTKASACGNDFLIIDARHAPAGIAAFSQKICDRHNGVGADGVEWLSAAPGYDAAIQLINADGTEAEISGNGTRCVAAYLVDQNLANPGLLKDAASGKLAIRTGAGVKHCQLISRAANSFEFAMDMGEPAVDSPFAVPLRSGQSTGTPVSMGNPHFVIFLDTFPANWTELGAEVQRQPNFKEGMNVEFVRVTGPQDIEVRFFERGVGETQSSGTGSCASAVAAIAAGKVASTVNVHAPGGTQVVRWEKNVFLRGPAQLICRGEFLG